MLQHVLIGDLAPLCLLAGLNGPMLRPLLAFRAVERLRVLANPFVALPIWATNLYVWHLTFLYEAAVEHSVVHALKHMCFFSAGIVAWLPVLETLPAPEWFGTGSKLAYIAIVQLVGRARERLHLVGRHLLRGLRPRRRALGHLAAAGRGWRAR